MGLMSTNPFPSMLYVEGTTPSSPSSGQQRLFVRSSDHVLCMVNSSGTVTPLSGALTNPMTTKGDIILGDTGGAPTRLGAGTSGQVLTSAGAGAFPAYAGKGLISFSSFLRSSGSYTVNSATWTNLDTGSDLVCAAAAGDVVQIEGWGVWGTENISVDFDVMTLVSSAGVHWFGPGEPTNSTGSGIWAVSRPASTVLKPFGFTASLLLVSGDISGGNVTLRIRVRSSGSITLNGGTLDNFYWAAKVFRI